MFEVGFTEIILILGLALLVLGPEKLPGLAEKVGRWTGRARSMARQLRTQLEHEVTMEELARSRPVQPPPSAEPAAQDPASHTPHPGPGIDLDTMVPGNAPAAEAPPAATPETSTTKPAQ